MYFHWDSNTTYSLNQGHVTGRNTEKPEGLNEISSIERLMRELKKKKLSG